jgi:hypothetical protein
MNGMKNGQPWAPLIIHQGMVVENLEVPPVSKLSANIVAGP